MEILSIIVPCYNEEEVLPIFYKETTEVLKNMDVDYEIIYVDDGSKDDTLKLLKEHLRTSVTQVILMTRELRFSVSQFLILKRGNLIQQRL